MPASTRHKKKYAPTFQGLQNGHLDYKIGNIQEDILVDSRSLSAG